MANENTSAFSSAVKTLYERRLLTRAQPRLLHARWATPATLSGYGVYELRKYGALSAVTTALSAEGVTPDEQSAPSLTVTTCTPVWYGAWLGYTDKLNLVSYDPIVSMTAGILGEQAGLSTDTLVRTVLVADATLDYSGGQTAIGSLVAVTHKLNYADFVTQIAELEKADGRPVDGEDFAVIIHPYTWATLMQDPTFVSLFIRESATALRSGLVGRLLRCQIYVSSNAKSYADEGSGSSDPYAMIFIGAESYGICGIATLLPQLNPDGQGTNAYTRTGQAEVRPVEIIMRGLGETGFDPLKQRGTMGWKAAHVSTVLNANWIRNLVHINDFS
jgi:N4-gp56 family major capsid protein